MDCGAGWAVVVARPFLGGHASDSGGRALAMGQLVVGERTRPKGGCARSQGSDADSSDSETRPRGSELVGKEQE